MKSRITLIALVASTGMAVTGCLNMPTQPSQITGTYVSGIKYENYDLERLKLEYDSLCRRESQLALAQEQRYKTSKTQAFWWGFGQGDGIEASELANVRGEKEAVRHAMELKGYAPAEPPAPQKAEKQEPRAGKQGR